MSDLFLINDPLLQKQNISFLLNTAPANALKILIVQASQKIDTSEFINLTIKTILQTKVPPETLKLFYNYISLIPKTDSSGRILGEVLLLTNQIRKDLQSVNEYIRGSSMQCVLSFINLSEIIDNFYKPLKENLNHKHSYVRRWAIHVLTEYYLRDSIKYNEVKQLIYTSLLTEREPFCMRQIYSELIRMKHEEVYLYKPEIKNAPTELLELIIQNCDDFSYIFGCIEKTPYYSSIKILKAIDDDEFLENNRKIILEKSITLLLKCERKKDAIKQIVDLDSELFKGYLNYILDIINEDNSLITHPYLIEFIFEITEKSEQNVLIDFLLNMLKVNSGGLKLFLLQKISLLLKNYSIKSELIIEEVKEYINNNDPAISYEALQFLGDQKEFLNCIQLENIKFGKIFRKALSIIKNKIYNEAEVEKKVELFEKALEAKNIQGNERLPILESLYNEKTPFIGPSIALFFEFLGKRIYFNDDLKARIIALLLKFIIYGEKTEKMDKSSHLTILMCVKEIYSGNNRTPREIKEDADQVIKKGTVLDPPEFPFIKTKSEIKNTCNDLGIEKENIIQLTGISDPIYCEANVKISKFEIIIDLMLINQTNSLLQNVIVDFTTSQNILLASSTNSIPNLQARCVKKLVLNYKIEECSNSFLCGNITFNFPGEKGQYSNSFYTLSLGEIKLEIADFLGGTYKIKNANEFRDEWIKLEWENTYSVKLSNPEILKKGLFYLRDKINNFLKGKILNEEGDDNYLVCNFICSTLLGDDILINTLISMNENISLECRIRSGSENVVKSVSALISECVRNI